MQYFSKPSPKHSNKTKNMKVYKQLCVYCYYCAHRLAPITVYAKFLNKCILNKRVIVYTHVRSKITISKNVTRT